MFAAGLIWNISVSSETKRLLNLLITGLDEGGVADVKYDKGRPVEINIIMKTGGARMDSPTSAAASEE